MSQVPGIPHRVHFVGIGGIGMSALARFLLARGHEVSGSDRQPGEQGEALQRLGARVWPGHQVQFVEGAELVVVTSAVRAGNPEVMAAQAASIPVLKRSELLATIVNRARGIAVAGTHGKTTTSALIGHILTVAQLDPTILIGGISLNANSNARVGGDLVVAEADEYDASFLRLKSEIAVITNVEPEHLDFYGTAESVYAAFREFAGGVRDLVIVCADDPVALEVTGGVPCRRVTYGIDEGEYRATDIEEGARDVAFETQFDGSPRPFLSGLPGLHNVRNALAALAVADWLGVSVVHAQYALATFKGVARRAEIKGEAREVLVMDDYAVHPTEIRATLEAISRRYQRPIRLVFQPHTYSRTHAFLDSFASSFGGAASVYLLDIYAAREADTLGVSGQTLADATTRQHAAVTYTPTAAEAIDLVTREANPGDLVLTMGAGDVHTLGPAILRKLEAP